MTEPPDMNEPVTRQELHDALEIWGGKLRSEMAEMKTELRSEMAEMKTELRSEMSAIKKELRGEMTDLRGQMSIDFGRWANTIIEALRADWRAQLEPHNGVPERVTKLEEELVPRVERLEVRVFAPKRRPATPRSRSRSRRR